MHWDRIQDQWTELRAQILAHWDDFSATDLALIDGSRSLFIATLQGKRGIAFEEASGMTERWAAHLAA